MFNNNERSEQVRLTCNEMKCDKDKAKKILQREERKINVSRVKNSSDVIELVDQLINEM